MKNTVNIANLNCDLLNVIPKDFRNAPADFSHGWLYLGDDAVRYVLGKVGENNMLVFGRNPGSAKNPDIAHTTVTKVIKILYQNCYDGWIMMNLSPQRSGNPKALKNDTQLFKNNIAVLKFLLNKIRVNAVWCAWGNDMNKVLCESWEDIKTVLESHHLELYHYGELTEEMNPRSPLARDLGKDPKFMPY